MLLSNPVGSTWGTGVRRAPLVTTWGWTTAVVSKIQLPTLLISGAHDKQVNPDRVRELYAALGSPKKVFIDPACSSHNAMWEKNHLLLFKASLSWLVQGGASQKVGSGHVLGQSQRQIKMFRAGLYARVSNRRRSDG